MSEKEFHYRWEYELRAEPCALWPLVSDTNRFNRDAGLPDVALRQSTEPEPGRAARRRLRLSKFGVGVEWEEEPFEKGRRRAGVRLARQAGGRDRRVTLPSPRVSGYAVTRRAVRAARRVPSTFFKPTSAG